MKTNQEVLYAKAREGKCGKEGGGGGGGGGGRGRMGKELEKVKEDRKCFE